MDEICLRTRVNNQLFSILSLRVDKTNLLPTHPKKHRESVDQISQRKISNKDNEK